jgi:hypothetical protein
MSEIACENCGNRKQQTARKCSHCKEVFYRCRSCKTLLAKSVHYSLIESDPLMSAAAPVPAQQVKSGMNLWGGYYIHSQWEIHYEISKVPCIHCNEPDPFHRNKVVMSGMRLLKFFPQAAIVVVGIFVWFFGILGESDTIGGTTVIQNPLHRILFSLGSIPLLISPIVILIIAWLTIRLALNLFDKFFKAMFGNIIGPDPIMFPAKPGYTINDLGNGKAVAIKQEIGKTRYNSVEQVQKAIQLMGEEQAQKVVQQVQQLMEQMRQDHQ